MVPFIEREGIDKLVASYRFQRSTRQNFMAYAQRNCAAHREKAYAQIVEFRKELGLQLPHALGACNGGHPETAKPTPRVTSLYPEPGQTSNADTFKRYKFVLSMENSKTPGYISEKLFIAFVSGVVPVYWGT